MAANVESMFSTREKPWHGLGTIVSNAPTSVEALELAGLDWRVIQKEISEIQMICHRYLCQFLFTFNFSYGIILMIITTFIKLI